MPSVDLLVEVAEDAELDVVEVEGCEGDVDFFANLSDSGVQLAWK